VRFKVKDKYEWHRKFAWIPTKVEGVVVWFEWYERRWVLETLWQYFTQSRLIGEKNV
jgi:hypothetical protein